MITNIFKSDQTYTNVSILEVKTQFTESLKQNSNIHINSSSILPNKNL